jgi:hypothetical protein
MFVTMSTIDLCEIIEFCDYFLPNTSSEFFFKFFMLKYPKFMTDISSVKPDNNFS